MEGALSATTTLLLSSAAPQICRTQLPLRPITTTANAVFQRSPFKLRTAGAAFYPVRCRLECVPSSAASFASSGDGGEVKENELSPLSSDVIVLDVRGMMCGGCASSVKRILENQSQVSSANVDHTTETAIVWPISEAKVTPNWQKVVGEELAKNLTNCGFNSNVRGEAAATEG